MYDSNIQFPLNNNVTGMYYTINGNVTFNNESKEITIPKGSNIATNTFFNGINITQLRKFTNIKEIIISLEIKGKAQIELHSVDTYKGIKDDLISIMEVSSNDYELCSFNIGVDNFNYAYFKIVAISDVFYKSGKITYCPIEDTGKKVSIAIIICTFKREQYIKKNIENMKNTLSELLKSNQINIYISDNGHTLNKADFNQHGIYLFENKNFGGSGGFSRGMYECSKKKWDYVLVMDDDILLDPEVIVRTQNMASLLKEEYKKSFIGSSFLDIDNPTIQIEHGGIVKNGRPFAQNTNKDMTDLSNLYPNDRTNYDYFGWWYCCFPFDFLDTGYTLPLFIKRDDVEFCYRQKATFVTFNGIGVWHENYIKKYSFENTYYQSRNNLIFDALYNPDKNISEIEKEIQSFCIKNLNTCRYCIAELFLDGVDDYLKGIDWLKTTNSEEIHQRLRKKVLKQFSIDDKITPAIVPNNKKILKKLTLNGHIGIKKGKFVTDLYDYDESHFYRPKVIYYCNQKTGMSYSETKSLKKYLKIKKHCAQTCRQLRANQAKIVYRFNTESKSIMSAHFWQIFLGVDL